MGNNVATQCQNKIQIASKQHKYSARAENIFSNVSWPGLALPHKETANRTEFYGGKYVNM